MTTGSLNVQKLRHPIQARLLTVKHIAELSPSMRRITLTGEDLASFVSASFDDHVKLFIPEAPGQQPNMPTIGATGLSFDESRPRPAMRDYTPRRYDPHTQELDIDFVLGHEGPATSWATHARPGHFLGIAGPRGSFVVPTTFDWHVLIGDETALPALSRRLEELPASTRAIVVVKTAHEDGRIALSSQCEREEYWVSAEGQTDASGTGPLESAVRNLILPEGEGYVWAAGEYSEIKAIRHYLVTERGVAKDRIRAASYWRKSVSDAHEQFE